MKRFFSLLMIPMLGVALSLSAPIATAQGKQETEEMKKTKGKDKDKDKDGKKDKPKERPLPPNLPPIEPLRR